MKLTRKEEEVMMAFWETDQPLGVFSLARSLPHFNLNTMRAVLTKLKRYGLIECEGVEEEQGSSTRTYRPTMSQIDYLESNFDRNMIFPFVARLVEQSLSDKDLEKLEAIIQSKKGK